MLSAAAVALVRAFKAVQRKVQVLVMLHHTMGIHFRHPIRYFPATQAKFKFIRMRLQWGRLITGLLKRLPASPLILAGTIERIELL
jgi:hypothetical protein